MATTMRVPAQAEFAVMDPATFVHGLREQLRQPGNGMYDHPFVRDVEAGTVTLSQLQFQTEQFYLHIRNMLPWIGEICVKCPYPDVAQALVKNYAEEMLGTFTKTGPHPELLLRFGESIGLDPEKARAAEQVPASRRLTEYFEFMSTRRDWFVALAAIGIGLESFVPDLFTRLVAAFRTNYHLTNDDLIFWTMHILADSDHGDEGIEIVSKYATTPAERKVVYECTLETGQRFYDMWNLYRTVE
ncbi:MAG: TenA family transcriptional regulator [Acidimicrobiia bacterium]